MHEISTQTKCLQKALSGQVLNVNNRPAQRLASISSEAVSFEGQGPKTHCSELDLINQSLRTFANVKDKVSDLDARDKGNLY